MRPAGAAVPFYSPNRKPDKKKGVGFGYGKRLSPVKKSESPGPGRYADTTSASLEGRPKPTKNGKFGVGREQVKFVSLIEVTFTTLDL